MDFSYQNWIKFISMENTNKMNDSKNGNNNLLEDYIAL